MYLWSPLCVSLLGFLPSNLLFPLFLSFLIFIHELAHFLAGKAVGIHAEVFSIGFGKPLLTRRAADGVEWVVSAIPLGGYVKMLDSREGEVPEHERHLAFDAQPVGKRTGTLRDVEHVVHSCAVSLRRSGHYTMAKNPLFLIGNWGRKPDWEKRSTNLPQTTQPSTTSVQAAVL